MPRTYHIETFGCQMNVHDSERLAGLLELAGYQPADHSSSADVVVLNTCSVRERAAEKVFSRVGELKAESDASGRAPVIAIAGCLAQQEGATLFRRASSVDVVVGTRASQHLPALVAEAARDNTPQVDIHPYDDVPSLPGLARRQDPVRAYVTIVEGCNERCAFCVVPRTRGRERMRPRAAILDEVREAVSTGHSEVHLLGQIVNHYRAPDDPACDFAGLLEAVDGIPGVARIRFASPHPRHVGERLIEAIAELPHVCKHLHLPVQSGSTTVLAAMRRHHTREAFLDLTATVKARVPGVQLSTDVIVGFPGESAADFDGTLSLLDQVRFHSMFSFKYSERPNTLAARCMPDTVPDVEKTRRLQALQERQREIQMALHQAAVGASVEVLVDGVSRRRGTELTGRTSGNSVVNFPGDPAWRGRMVRVRVARAGPNSLWGEIVDPPRKAGSVPLAPSGAGKPESASAAGEEPSCR
jgi:tRNA-2-methylthio-N6-dimethylallyladenosine synthase